MVPPSHPGVSYVDHLDTEGLRKKYLGDPNVDLDRLVPVSYVWDARPLSEVVSGKRFTYAVGSHVAEHAPDLIGWMRQLAEILAPGGQLALVLPDMRYTFDCQRKVTTIAELVEAYLYGYRRPSIRQILDHFFHKAEVPAQCTVEALWERPERAQFVPRSRPHLLEELGESGLCHYRKIVDEGQYIDSHCSVFTPASFLSVLESMTKLGLGFFSVKHMLPTQRHETDFLLVLERVAEELMGPEACMARSQLILQSLPELQDQW